MTSVLEWTLGLFIFLTFIYLYIYIIMYNNQRENTRARWCIGRRLCGITFSFILFVVVVVFISWKNMTFTIAYNTLYIIYFLFIYYSRSIYVYMRSTFSGSIFSDGFLSFSSLTLKLSQNCNWSRRVLRHFQLPSKDHKFAFLPTI